MPVEVILPKVDMDMATGQISRWFVEEGATVKQGDVLFEMETDKAAMEVDAPASGIIRDITGKENVAIPVGQAVAWIYAEGEAPVSPPMGESQASSTATGGSPPALRRAEDGAEAVTGATPPRFTGEGDHAKRGGEGGSVRATPLARRLAREAGLDLATLTGSGPKGRVLRGDVEAAVASAGEAARHGAAPALAASSLVAQVRPQTAPRQADGAPLNHVWLRQGEGRAIVLVHGFGADLNNWRPLLAGGPVDAPVLALDLPGHGGSPRRAPHDLDEIAEDVEATLAALGVGPMLLAGHSFGGAVAATVAARGNADIRALALIAPAGLGPEINGAFLEGFLRAKSEASLLPWLRLLVADESVLSRLFVNATLAQAQDAELRAAQAAIADRFFADGTQVFTIRSLLGGLRIPVRVIVGANDRIIPAGQTAGLPGEVALHVFSGTGHMPQVERREQVLKILLEMARA